MRALLVKWFGASWFTTVCGYVIGAGVVADMVVTYTQTNGMPEDPKDWLLLLAAIAIKRTKMDNVTNASDAVPAKIIQGPTLPLKTVVQEGHEDHGG